MEKSRATVGLIYGGAGRESEVSLKGREHILPKIDKEKYDVTEIFIDKGGRWIIDGRVALPCQGGFCCPDSGAHYGLDCAFPLLHGDKGEDGSVQGALECAGIAYVGCSSFSGAVCRDKAIVKTVAQSLGMPTLPYLLILRAEGIDYAVRRAEETLCYPMFVKPTSLGSSFGVSAAEQRRELISAITVAFTMAERVIIEPCLTHKRELECGYLSGVGKELFSCPGEILCQGTYGYDEKYTSGKTGLAIRADLNEGISEAVREYSRRLVRALGVRDLARIDFFLSGERLYFNEINTMPGFTEGSLYPKMIEACGISEGRLINGLIENAIARG